MIYVTDGQRDLRGVGHNALFQELYGCDALRIVTSWRPNSRSSNEIAQGPKIMSTADITTNSNAAILESNSRNSAGGMHIAVISAPLRQIKTLAFGAIKTIYINGLRAWKA